VSDEETLRWINQQRLLNGDTPYTLAQYKASIYDGTQAFVAHTQANPVEHALPALLDWRVDWHDLFNRETETERWLAHPVVPEQRVVAIYSPAGSGKSLVAQEIALSVARGEPLWEQERSQCRPVLYIDLEMSPDDLLGRLEAMGYEDPAQLNNLHWIQPTIGDLGGGLDTEEGQNALIDAALHVQAGLVIIDTTTRSVGGDENDSTTARRLAHTTLALKRAGMTVLRLGHSGKDITRQERGSSSLRDAEDVIWRLTQTDGGVQLRCEKSRVGWIDRDKTIDLTYDKDTMTHRLAQGRQWHARTKEIAYELDRLGVPLDAGKRAAGRALREHGKVENKALIDALAWRRQDLSDLAQPVDNFVRDPNEVVRDYLRTTPSEEGSRTTLRTTPENSGPLANMQVSGPDHFADHPPRQGRSPSADRSRTIGADRSAGPPPGPSEDLLEGM
jgi:hypothetical protein